MEVEGQEDNDNEVDEENIDEDIEDDEWKTWQRINHAIIHT